MGATTNVLAEQAQGGNPIVSMLPLILIAVAFYFFLIRPQSKRRREQLEMQSSIEPGSRIMTTSGMYATVVAVDDDGLTLEIAPGVEARFVKQAVMQVIKDDEDAGAAEADLDDEADTVDETEDAGAKADLTKPAGKTGKTAE